MIKYLKKSDSWLVIIPFLFFVITRVWFRDKTIDIHLHDTMYVMSGWIIFLILLVLLVFYFIMHSFLRIRKWRIKTVCDIHVIGTAISLLVIGAFIIFPDQGRINQALTAETYIQSVLLRDRLSQILAVIVLIFGLLQVLFFLYFLFEVIRKEFVSKTK
jgi:H+/gluconate symporter-like permease